MIPERMHSAEPTRSVLLHLVTSRMGRETEDARSIRRDPGQAEGPIVTHAAHYDPRWSDAVWYKKPRAKA